MDALRPNLVWVDGACYRVSHTVQAAHQDEDPDDFIRGETQLLDAWEWGSHRATGCRKSPKVAGKNHPSTLAFISYDCWVIISHYRWRDGTLKGELFFG